MSVLGRWQEWQSPALDPRQPRGIQQCHQGQGNSGLPFLDNIFMEIGDVEELIKGQDEQTPENDNWL